MPLVRVFLLFLVLAFGCKYRAQLSEPPASSQSSGNTTGPVTTNSFGQPVPRLGPISTASSIAPQGAVVDCDKVSGPNASICRPLTTVHTGSGTEVPDLYLVDICSSGQAQDCETEGSVDPQISFPSRAFLSAQVATPYACVESERDPGNLAQAKQFNGKTFHCVSGPSSLSTQPGSKDNVNSQLLIPYLQKVKAAKQSYDRVMTQFYGWASAATLSCRSQPGPDTCADSNVTALGSLVDQGTSGFAGYTQSLIANPSAATAAAQSMQTQAPGLALADPTKVGLESVFLTTGVLLVLEYSGVLPALMRATSKSLTKGSNYIVDTSGPYFKRVSLEMRLGFPFDLAHMSVWKAFLQDLADRRAAGKGSEISAVELKRENAILVAMKDWTPSSDPEINRLLLLRERTVGLYQSYTAYEANCNADILAAKQSGKKLQDIEAMVRNIESQKAAHKIQTIKEIQTIEVTGNFPPKFSVLHQQGGVLDFNTAVMDNGFLQRYRILDETTKGVYARDKAEALVETQRLRDKIEEEVRAKATVRAAEEAADITHPQNSKKTGVLLGAAFIAAGITIDKVYPSNTGTSLVDSSILPQIAQYLNQLTIAYQGLQAAEDALQSAAYGIAPTL